MTIITKGHNFDASTLQVLKKSPTLSLFRNHGMCYIAKPFFCIHNLVLNVKKARVE